MVRRKFRNVKKRNKEAERKKRTQVIISVFFVGLMVFSVLGIYVSQQQNASLDEFSYQDYEFKLVEDTPGQNVLVTMVDGEEKVFYSLPQDTLRIPLEGNLTQVVSGVSHVALANNPSPELAPIIDLMRFDFDRYAQVLVASVPLQTENITGINCLNATPEVPIITFEEDVESSIIVEGSCIQIKAQPNDLYLIRDRLLYSFLGILNR